MLKITILGCGSSFGVPVIGCDCNTCNSLSPYNKRTRSSIFIDDGEGKILVDFGFEIREQLIKAGIKKLDAAILTHDHADHVSGIDNLKVFSLIQNKALSIYTDHQTAKNIEERYNYLFVKGHLINKVIDFYDKIKFGNLEILFFRQHHSQIDSLGIRVGNFVYSNDVSAFPEETKPFLENIEAWVLDCFNYKATSNHAGLDLILKWQEIYKPQKIYLTNMRHEIEYHQILKLLPPNIIPLYDGFVINLK